MQFNRRNPNFTSLELLQNFHIAAKFINILLVTFNVLCHSYKELSLHIHFFIPFNFNQSTLELRQKVSFKQGKGTGSLYLSLLLPTFPNSEQFSSLCRGLFLSYNGLHCGVWRLLVVSAFGSNIRVFVFIFATS